MTRTNSPVFAGRRDELRALREALATAERGEPRTVVLAGEAGVGKSRLITEFTDEARDRGARVLVGGALELGSEGLPFAPFTAALRGLSRDVGIERLRAVVPELHELSPLLPELREAGSPADETARSRLFERFLLLLEGLSATAPLVLVVEDLHWADRSTRELLVFITRSLHSARVLLIASYRSDDVGRKHPLRPLLAELGRVHNVDRIEIPRLTRAEIAEQAGGILGHEPELDLLERLVTRTDGNPFFVEALLESGDEARCDIEDSLRDLLLREVEQLPAGSQRALRVAAAGGTRVEYALLAAVSTEPEDQLAADLRAAVERNILLVDGRTLSFRHALIQEAVHDELLPGERTALHRRYAEALEADPTLVSAGRAGVEIAHHWYAAHNVEWALVSAWSAAAEAEAACAYAEQLALLERVLTLWEQVPSAAERLGVDHVAVLFEAGNAARRGGEPARGAAYATSALAEVDRAGDPLRAAEIHLLRGRCRQHLDLRERLNDLQAATDLAAAEPGGLLHARALSQLAIIEAVQREHERAGEHAERALELGRGLDDGTATSFAYNALGLIAAHEGRIDEATTLFEQCQAEAARVGATEELLRAATNYSDPCIAAGRYEQAIEIARAGMARASAAGLARTQATFLSLNYAEPLIRLGRWDEAEKVIAESLALDPPTDSRGFLFALRAIIAVGRGRLEAARAAAVQSREDVHRGWNPQLHLPRLHTDAAIELVAGDPAESIRIIRAIQPLVTNQLPREIWPVLVLGAAACARLITTDEERALDALDYFAGHADAVPITSPVEQAAADTFHAYRRQTLGQPADWDSVAAAHSRLGQRFDQATALFEAAVAADDPAAVRERIEPAHRIATELRAEPLLAAIAALAGQARIPLAETTRTGSAAGLTARELDVLHLIAEGKSNREIGAALYISPKTASVHVSNILAKLGVESRTAAAAAAHQRRLLSSPA
ncbi:MAG TPA: AAA family ATPase [Mycobacteriales bacterium]|nr:AAA family ATPase [Mycobacteriales bacterium]